MKSPLISLLLQQIVCFSQTATAVSPKIGIIGGGIGGTGAAYFINELFGIGGIEIDLYESGEIGGRLATVNVDGFDYEMGGSVIHPKNHYVVELMKHLDLKPKTLSDSTFGLYDGNKFVFRETSSWGFINTLKLLWRYGISLLRMQDYVNDMLTKFERIYSLQESKHAFPSVSDLLKGLDTGLSEALHISLKEALDHEGFPKHLIEELITAALVVDYGQTTDVHQFVGSVALAGASPGLFAINGGNRRLPEKLLHASGASLKRSRVTCIELLDTGRYLVHSGENNSAEYDAVIMAVPYATNILSNLTFKNFPHTFIFERNGNYHRTVATIVQGTLNHTFFGFEKENDIVDQISCIRTDLMFNSVGRVYPVNVTTEEKSNVWKLFSQVPLTTELLSSMFISTEQVIVKDWLAYPHYQAEWRHDKFRIYDYLYHVNGIEWAASAMEMSLIGAKNVALMLYYDWGNIVEETTKANLKMDL